MEKSFDKVNIGDVVVCCDSFAHDYVEYELRITEVETEKAKDTGAECDCIVAYGQGVTDEDTDYIEDMGYGFRVDGSNFVRFIEEVAETTINH